MKIRILLVGATAAVLAAGCAPPEQQTLPAPTAPQSASPSSSASAATCPQIHGKQATCGTVTKTRFEPAGIWPSAWTMTIKRDDGNTVVVKGKYGPTARDLSQLISPGDRVAYVLPDDEFVGTSDVRVL